MRTLPLSLYPLFEQLQAVNDPELHRWLREAVVQRQCDPNELVEALVASGRPLEASAGLVRMALAGMFIGGEVDPRFAPRSVMGTPEVPYGEKHFIDLGDRTARKILSLGSMEVALYESFLSDEECEHIKKASAPLLRRSSVVGENFSSVETRIRTSAGAFLDREMDPTISAIEHRIARLLNVPVTHGEGLQVLHYVDAQEYQPHYDFFEPQNEQEKRMMEVPGNRTGTLILYLNDVEEGGSTYFPQLKMVIHPKKGSALWFSYYSPEDGVFDRRSEHAGLPVIQGEKWIATKWVRQRPFMAEAGKSMDIRYDDDAPAGNNVTPFPGRPGN